MYLLPTYQPLASFPALIVALVTLTRYPSRCDAVIAASWLSSVHSSDAGSFCVEASVLAQPLIFQYYKANS